MRALVLGIALLTQASLTDGILGDREVPWDDDYHQVPGWVATVEAYRKVEYARREIRARQAGDDAAHIAIWMSVLTPVVFLAGATAVWLFGSKQDEQLRDYVHMHHQTADEIDKMTGAKAILDARYKSRERAGLGQQALAEMDYMAIVEGRFGISSNVERAGGDDSLEEKIRKKQARFKHVQSLVERSFAAVDTDKSGQLNREEIRQMLKTLELPHGEAELDSVMLEFDPDHSGTVSFKEFQVSWQKRHQDEDGTENPTNATFGDTGLSVVDAIANASINQAKKLEVQEFKANGMKLGDINYAET